MKENSFLTVYRYIEVDEDCDLDKMQELEKEFLALGDILGKHPYDASIRFRKLDVTMLPAFIPRPTSAYALMSAPQQLRPRISAHVRPFMEC